MAFDPKIGGIAAGLAAPADTSTWLSLKGLDALKAGAATKSPEAVKAVAQQFESLFLGMMLKSMRDAKLGEAAFDSDETRFYQDLFDKQISLSMAQGKGLGIADMLVRQLGGSAASTAPRGAAPAVPLASLEPDAAGAGPRRLLPGAIAAALAGEGPAAGPTAPRPPPEPSAAGPFAATPEDFVRRVLPHAERAAGELGIDPLALVAQAALETGWGRSVPATADGAGFNLFGIKAGGSWAGQSIARTTLEFQNGAAVLKREPFRAYASVGEAFGDLVGLLTSSPRYAAVPHSGAGPAAYGRALQSAGYATDPDYARKIRGIAESAQLNQIVKTLKDGAAAPTR